jgi:uncharacterized phage-associated protein
MKEVTAANAMPMTASKKVRDAVAYVVAGFCDRQRAPLTRTKLVKYLYLADLMATKQRGKPVTDLQYRSYYYGPYAPEILDAAENQPQYIAFERAVRSDGAPYYAYRPTDARPKLDALSGEDRAVIDAVLEHYGDYSLKKLLRTVYETEPFKKTEMLETIDLTV